MFVLYFPFIVEAGLLYKAIPPLYSIKDGKKTKYFTENIDIVKYIEKSFFANNGFKKLNKTDDTIATNAYSVIGKKAIVTQDIDPTLGYGQIKVNGETWSAKTISDNIIPKDSEVIIKNIEGVKAVVELLNEKVNA